MKTKIWIAPEEYDKQRINDLSEQSGVSRTVVSILYGRGLDTAEKITDFFSQEPAYNSPLLLKDGVVAAKRILKAVNNNEKILIYGDYDVDGICSASLFYRFLTDYLGATNVEYFIPCRVKDGYGLNKNVLLDFAAQGFTLLISVDCGISNYEEVAAVNELMDVVITDHHQIPDILPKALAIVNPQQVDCMYPFKALAGVGVAFKVCQMVWQIYKNDENAYFDELLELVALATVADIVPLMGENRNIVKRGLARMQNTDIVGLQALAAISGYSEQKITSTALGFNIAPRLNAVGRLGDAKVAVKMLVTKDKAQAQEIAAFLDAQNAQRQAIEGGIFKEVENYLAQHPPKGSIVISGKGWNIGVIGIVSSKLVEKYYLPTILLGIDDCGVAKGSGRSIQALDLYKTLQSMQDLFLNFGGHHQAAGLTLAAENLPEFTKRFEQYIEDNLIESDFIPNLRIDCRLDELRDLNDKLLRELEEFEPCGFGNHRPKLVVSGVTAERVSTFSDGAHLRMQLLKKDIRRPSIMWKAGALAAELNPGSLIDVAFNLNVDNRQAISMTLLDVHPRMLFADYRYKQQFDVEEYLRNLNATPSAVLYAQNEQPGCALTQIDRMEALTTDKDTIYIYDVLPESELQVLRRKLCETDHVVKIVFLFKIKAVQERLDYAQQNLISRDSFKRFFLALKQELQNRPDGIAWSELQKLYWFADFDEVYLQVLQELGLIELREQRIYLIYNCKKCELTDSTVFVDTVNLGKRAVNYLIALKNQSMAELFKLM